MAQFQNGGALFARQKKSPKSADYGGDFTIEGDVLDYVLRCVERNEPVKLDISGWAREGRNNTRFISLSIEKPYAMRQQQQSTERSQYRQQDSRQDNRGGNSYQQQRSGGERSQYNGNDARGREHGRDYGQRRPVNEDPWND